MCGCTGLCIMSSHTTRQLDAILRGALADFMLLAKVLASHLYPFGGIWSCVVYRGQRTCKMSFCNLGMTKCVSGVTAISGRCRGAIRIMVMIV